jgi:phosphoserine phosphatase
MLSQEKSVSLLKNKLIAFDFDGTLTTADNRSSWETVHKYFGTWTRYGKPALEKFLRGEITYLKFCKLDAESWMNKTESEYQQALNVIKLREGISELFSFLRKNGYIVTVISMGLSDIVKKVNEKLNFDYWIANELIRKNNRITGEIKINIDWGQKGIILNSVLQHFNINKNNSIAVGDASADIDMFEVAQISIAMEPSSLVVASAANYICQTNDLREIISILKSI